jgi:hypothetical protein
MSVVINGSAGVTTNSGAVYDGIQRGTAVTCAGQTSIDFTSIPSWVKRITVIFNGVSTSGTSNILVQLGDSGGVETTGYVSQANTFNAAPGSTASTAGFLMLNTTVAAISYSGVVPICNLNGNDWVTSGVLVASTAAQGVSIFGGIKTLSATLDRVRITTVNGTDTFDTTPSAGSINILYE